MRKCGTLNVLKFSLSNLVESQDVQEAIRLVREALLTYAIDPLTGKIDMDLINTGKSGALREKMEHIKSIIVDILNKKSPTAEYNSLVVDIRIAAGMVLASIFCLIFVDC